MGFLRRNSMAGVVGFSIGLATARLLYEYNPLRFSAFGGFLASVLLAAILAALWIWLVSTRSPVEPRWSYAVPVMLVWLYILTPADTVNIVRGLLLIIGTVLLTSLLPAFNYGDKRTDWLGGALLVLIGLINAYLPTLQRTVGRADTFEFQVTAPVLGVAHPTGYPLYTLFGGLFSILPLGHKIATRVNLTSLVSAIVACMLVYALLSFVLKRHLLLSVFGALLIGFGPVLWSQAVVAEVYAFHNMLAAAILALALWIASRTPNAIVESGYKLTPPQPREVILLLGLCGLSLTNHLTTVILLPGVAVALLATWPRLTWQQWAVAFTAFFGALLIYLYIPIRWPALHDGTLMPVGDFIGWITGSRFSGALQLRAWLTDAERWRIVGRLLLDQYGWFGVIGGIVGFGLLAWRRWAAAIITGVVFLGYGFYGLNYLVSDIAVFIIPMYVILGIWTVYGLGEVAQVIEERLSGGFQGLAQAGAVTGLAFVAFYSVWTNAGSFNWHDEIALEEWGRYVLSLPLDHDSAILADSEKIAPLEYLHRIEGYQPTIPMVVLGTEQDYFDNLFARLDTGQTVYLARLLPGLEGSFHLRSVGPLVEVGTEPLTDAPDIQGESIRWQNEITLLGITLDRRSYTAGSEAHLTLYWQPQETIPDNYHFHLRLLDSAGKEVWRSQPQFAADNFYPTVAWKPPEIITDYYAIPFSPALDSGMYRLQVAMTPPFSEEYALTTSGEEWAEIEALNISAAQNANLEEGQRTAISFESGSLIGISVSEQAPSGGRVQADILWRGASSTDLDYINATIGAETELVGIGFSEVMLVPEDDTDTLRWLLRGEGLRCGWLRPLTDSCVVAVTRIEGEAVDAIANYEDKILLTGLDFESGRLNPGENVNVTLTWQALTEIDEDYTIFVHLLGPDGRLHGQIDSWPVQGTYPTSAWPAGEKVTDRYSVKLNADAPPGAYRLEVGMYLLATNTRLSVVNELGTAVGDKVSFEGLIVPE